MSDKIVNHFVLADGSVARYSVDGLSGEIVDSYAREQIENITSYKQLYTGSLVAGGVDDYNHKWLDDQYRRSAIINTTIGKNVDIVVNGFFNRFAIYGKDDGADTYTQLYRVAPANVTAEEKYTITDNQYKEIVIFVYYGSAYTGETNISALQYDGTEVPVFKVNGVEVFTKEEYEKDTTPVYWENIVKPPYWVLHLDCARKYISVDNIKNIIDNISSAGFNQLQLHFSEDSGFRFSLASMIFDSEDGHRYDLANALGGTESETSWYSQSDMDTIINYAKGKGIDVVPSLDMPGHMGRILSVYPQFKYENSTTLDITNEQAVYFAKAIVEKYAKYFCSRGCKYWNVGFDEIVGSTGFETFYNNNEFHYCTDFANELAQVVIKNGLKPRIYNEAVYYRDNYNEFVSKEYEVYYWTRTNVKNAYSDQLMSMGYKLINNSYAYYWALGNTNMQVTPEQLDTTNLLSDFFNNTPNKNGYGAVLSIWCDNAGSVDAGDGGDSIVTDTAPVIIAFGNAINRALQ